VAATCPPARQLYLDDRQLLSVLAGGGRLRRVPPLRSTPRMRLAYVRAVGHGASPTLIEAFDELWRPEPLSPRGRREYSVNVG